MAWPVREVPESWCDGPFDQAASAALDTVWSEEGQWGGQYQAAAGPEDLVECGSCMDHKDLGGAEDLVDLVDRGVLRLAAQESAGRVAAMVKRSEAAATEGHGAEHAYSVALPEMGTVQVVGPILCEAYHVGTFRVGD